MTVIPTQAGVPAALSDPATVRSESCWARVNCASTIRWIPLSLDIAQLANSRASEPDS